MKNLTIPICPYCHKKTGEHKPFCILNPNYKKNKNDLEIIKNLRNERIKIDNQRKELNAGIEKFREKLLKVDAI